jgi:hypothetical protein
MLVERLRVAAAFKRSDWKMPPMPAAGPSIICNG